MTKRSQLLANLSSVTKAQCYGEKCPRSVLESSKRERDTERAAKNIIFSKISMINVLFERPLRIRQHFKHRLTRSPNIWTEFLDDVRMDEPEGVTLTDLLRRHIDSLMIIARKKRRGEWNIKHLKLRGPCVIPMGQQAGQHLWLLSRLGWLQVTEEPGLTRHGPVRPLPSSSRLQQHGSCLQTWDPAPSYSDESTEAIKYLVKQKIIGL